MANADPYVQRIPQSIVRGNDDELRAWFEYDNRWKHDIWQKLGGGGDSVEEALALINGNENQISFLTGYVSYLERRLQDAESVEVPVVNLPVWYEDTAAGGSFTAYDNADIDATLSAVITLPTSGQVKVNNLDGSLVTVNLSGSQTIFGETSVQIHSKGSIIFKYKPDSNQWVFE